MASKCTNAMPLNNTSTLHFVAFVPYMQAVGPIKADLFGYKAAIQMAVDIINNRSDILPNYKINMEYGETWVWYFRKVNRKVSFVEHHFSLCLMI